MPGEAAGSAPGLVTVVSGVSQTSGDATTGGLITSVTTSSDTSSATIGALSAVEAPLGTMSFTAEASKPTGTAGELISVPDTFSLYVDKSLGLNGFWVVDPVTGRLVNLASSEYGGQIIDSGDQLRIDIQVEDGSTFDNTGIDGSVQVDGALGFVNQSLGGFAPTPDSTAEQPVVFWF